MTRPSSHGATTRQPVVFGGRRIPNLTVRTLEDGTDVYEVRLRMPDGSQPRRVLDGVSTPGEAVRERNALLVDRDRGVAHENRLMNPTVAEVLDEYVADLERRTRITGRGRIAPNTYRLREVAVRCHLKQYRRGYFERLRVADLTIWDVRDVSLWLQSEEKGLAAKTAHNILSALSLALDLAVGRYIEHNVAKDLSSQYKPGQKRRTEPRYLTLDGVESLLAAAEDYYRPVFACCAYAALRIGEAFGLQWECVDFKADRIEVRQQGDESTGEIVPYTKTDAARATGEDALPLLPALKRELLAHRSRMAQRNLALVRPEALVFVGRRGQMLRQCTTLAALRRAASAVGLNPPGAQPVGHHDLRHSAASIALEHSKHEAAAKFMRHANAKVTLAVYGGLNEDRRGEAARNMLAAGFGA